MYKLTDTKEYCDLFPKIRDRLDLHEINRRCKQGQYKGNSGLVSLFDDLTLMCTNGKKFNSGNAGFQPWIMVDMMEKTLSRVLLSQKGAFTKHGCITSSATASSTSSQCLKSDSSQNNSNADDDPFQEEDAFQDVKSTILNDFDEEEFTQEV